MKKPLIVLAISILACISVFGQNASSKSAKARKPAAKKPVPKFIREKFDPARDPVADLALAVEAATKSGKRIILDVGGEWCGWCVHMDKYIYQNPKLAKLRDANFVWVKVNMSDENENIPFLSSYPKIDAYPHLFVLDEAGKLLHSQDTALLEAGKSYDLAKFTRFLKDWSPPRKAAVQ